MLNQYGHWNITNWHIKENLTQPPKVSSGSFFSRKIIFNYNTTQVKFDCVWLILFTEQLNSLTNNSENHWINTVPEVSLSKSVLSFPLEAPVLPAKIPRKQTGRLHTFSKLNNTSFKSMQTLPSQHFCLLLSSITFTELSSLNGFKMSRLSLDSFFAVLFIVVFDINEK